jgi:4-amino-4-deoxy-L-arabinose transferase-like glycosyltransferase
VTALAAVVISITLSPWQRDLFVGDETKYGQVVREMRTTSSWFLPTLDGHPFTHKPPLHFWLVDVLTLPFGVHSMWAFVLPSIVAFVFLLWLLAAMSGSRLTAFIGGSSLLIWASAQTARMDVSFTAFLVLAAWMLFVFFERSDFRALLVAAIALAIATLIKGPMAPVIGLVLFFLTWLRRRRQGGALVADGTHQPMENGQGAAGALQQSDDARPPTGVRHDAVVPYAAPAAALPRGNYWPAIAALVIIPLLWVIPAMILGGREYTREVVMKQTVGRAVASWVHQAPPWYYLAHLPALVAPWFLLALVAVIVFRRGTPLQRFCIDWILAVLVPYSLMSSKLDIYMMALLPPVAILVADLVTTGHRLVNIYVKIANAATLVIYAAIGATGVLLNPAKLKSPDAALLARDDVRTFFAIFAAVAIVELLLAARRTPLTSTIAVGLIPLIALAYAAVALMPLANDFASTRPLIAALERQHVPADGIALYSCPYLWSRDLPEELGHVHYVDQHVTGNPAVIATSRAHAAEIAPLLAGYRKVDSIRMIGKWFDVYRR